MNTPLEKREGDAPSTNLDSNRLKRIRTAISNKFEQLGATAALQLVMAFQRRDLPTLPKLGTPDPANPKKRIEGADALIIGERYIEPHGRREEVTLIALFSENPPFVEFRSYEQVHTDQAPGRTLLLPVGPLKEGHQLIFEKAEKPIQWELINLTLEAIYRQRAGESPLLKP